MNGILIIDKPTDWTSHDVVAKLRGIYHERRIGHTGTLDPMATGVLVVFLGRATRAVELLENDDKEYIAGLRLGTVTDTQDTTGSVLSESAVNVSDEQLQEALKAFTGPICQLPPMYSAIKVGGKKLYELARKGQSVERKPRSITIHALELLERNGNDCLLRVHCSKGTYVRTLCHDIGQALGCGGCMSSLRRTKAGRFTLEDAVTLPAVQEACNAGTNMDLLRPVDFLFRQYPAYTVNAANEKRCRNGSEFRVSVADGFYRVYDQTGTFLMLGECREGSMYTVKSFFEVNLV